MAQWKQKKKKSEFIVKWCSSSKIKRALEAPMNQKKLH